MPGSRFHRLATHAVLVLGLATGGAASGQEEVAERFLDRLTELGHADLVVDYLDRAATDPLVSDGFKSRIPLLRLTALVDRAIAQPDPAARAAQLEDAAAQLAELGDDDAVAALRVDIAGRIAMAAADGARREAVAARRLPDGRAKDRSLAAARDALATAQGQLEQAAGRFSQELERRKGVSADSDAGAERLAISGQLSLIRLLAARLVHEQAETFPSDSPDRKRLNTDAAKRFRSIYEKYSSYGVGLMAHLYEGRCYRLLGETALARAALEDLTSQPAATPDLRKIVTLAWAELSAQRLENGDAEAALERPAEWLDGLPAPETVGAEAATLRYRLAEAALAEAAAASDTEARRLRTRARDWLADSSREPSEVQADARQAWARVTAQLGLEQAEPETFIEAYEAGKEAVAAMAAARLAAESETDATARADLEQRRAESRAAGVASFGAALRLVGGEATAARVNETRYLLGWLYWDAGSDHQAAVLAEFVALRQPDDPSAEGAARLALAALERLQSTAGPDASAAISRRLRRVATGVIERSEGSGGTDASETAFAVLLNDALRSDELGAAEELLASVSDAQRPQLALRFAVARWEKLVREKEADRSGALERLERAFEEATAQGAGSSAAQAMAALYLAQAAVESGDAATAGELLSDKRYGPLALTDRNAPPADNARFQLESLKTKLRADALGGDADASLDRFGALIKSAPPEQTGGERAWLGLAVGLLNDLERAESRGDGSAPRIAKALGATLGRLDGLKPDADWNTLLWIAQAQLRIGEALGGGADAEQSLSAARDGFTELIDRAGRDAGFAPSATSVLAARLRQAECDRALGRYAEAVDAFAGLLEERRTLLDVQRAAAETLHQWGVATDDPSRIEQAIAGTNPGADGKNLVWGWSKLAAVAAKAARGAPKHRELFFRAWLGVAESRRAAALASDGTERQKQLGKAANTVRAMRRQYPDLGGEPLRSRFDQLLRQIQTDLGQEPVGLSANESDVKR